MPDFSPDFENSKKDESDSSLEEAKSEPETYRLHERDLFDQKAEKIWEKEFQNNPKKFFEDDNLESLSQYSTKTRLALLSRACAQLTITANHARKYSEEFSQDVEIIYDFYYKTRGETNYGLEFHLLSTFAPVIKDRLHDHIRNLDELKKAKENRGNQAYQWTQFSKLGRHLDVAERKERAEAHLMHDYQPGVGVEEKFAKFGNAADRIVDCFKDNYQLQHTGDHRLQTEGLFSSEAYQDLPDNEKAELLRTCLGEAQYVFIFEEVFNSEFSENIMNRLHRGRYESSFNPAHSYLYHTHQPSSAYDEAQKLFTHEMNNTAARGGMVEEYSNHRIVLAVLEEFKDVTEDSGKNTEYLVEFWDKNRNPIFANAISNALSAQNSELAASELMDKIRDDQTPNKNALAAILYRLELGKIGISEEGVQYLERQYDLRELNDPEFFAKRLTGKGQMGVFDEEGHMQGMFDLGDLTDGKKEIQAEVYDLTYEMLFVPKEDESEEERKRREQVLEEFKKHYFDFYGEEFHEQTGVYFNNLDLREQGAFMQFAREADDEQAEAAIGVVEEYGEPGLQSFVAHAENPDMGKVLLEIADSLPDAAAQSVFREYAGFVEVVNDLESYVADEFNVEDPDRLGNRVANAILERGEKLLRSARADKSDYDELSSTLSDLANSTLVFLHGLKELRRSDQPLDPELLEKSEMNRTDADSITDQEFAQMKDIYKRNYPQNKYDSAIQESLLSRLRDIRASENGEFYTLKYKGDIKAFLGLKEGEAVDGRPTKQAAAFNVDSEFQNFAVGHMMIENALVREADSSVLIANSNARSTLTAHYIERGFVGTRTSDQHGSEVLDIVWDKLQNNRYRFKYSSIDKIKETFTKHADTESAAKLETGEVITKKDSWEQIDLNQYLPGKAVTRAFSDEGKWYVVFEPAPDTEYPESMK